MTDQTLRFQAIFQSINEQLQASVGHALFTAAWSVPGTWDVERVFTTMPAEYPLKHWTKPDFDTDWDADMAAGRCFVANAPSQFGPHFRNLDTLIAQGFGAVINIPVVRDGRLLGTLNLLDKEGAYLGDVLPACLAVDAQAAEGFFEFERFAALRRAK